MSGEANPAATPSGATCRVTRIELSNFNSYYGFVTVGPFTDFSCIVGPNGSGKSNILESLAFVLGGADTIRNSIRGAGAASFVPKLRCRRLSELINRTAAAEATAEGREAECSVTIVFRQVLRQDGGVPTQVRLTRQVTSSNVVTVFLNGQRVSEQEFRKAQRALRISPRISTFLILQHEVESVARMRPRELTDMIEQISGSAELREEYAQRRRDLAATTEVLTAASVARRTASNQLNQAKMMRKENDRYRETSERLAAAHQEFALCELFFTECQLTAQKRAVESAQKELALVEGAAARGEAAKGLRAVHARKHKEFVTLLHRNRNISFTQREKRQECERSRNAIALQQRRIERLQFELKIAKEGVAARASETERIQKMLKQQEILLNRFDEQCTEEDKKLEKDGTLEGRLTADQLARYTKLKADADALTVTQRQELLTAERALHCVGIGRHHLKLAAENAEISRKELEALVSRTDARLDATKTRESDARAALSALEARLVTEREQLVVQEAKAKQQAEELAKVQQQLDELAYTREGNRAAARAQDALHSLKAVCPGVYGRFVDLCTIRDDRYKNAASVALGRNLDALVVDTTETAITCVRYLKEQRMPPMTFIPLNSIKGRPVNDRLRHLGGTCRPLSDVVEYEKEIEKAVWYAFGQTLVCDTIEEARAIAYPDLVHGSVGRAANISEGYKSGVGNDEDEDMDHDADDTVVGSGRQRRRVVTLDGTILSTNGSMQGGLASARSRAMKWDDKKYEKLKALKEKLLAELGEESLAQRSSYNIRDIESRIEAVKREIAATETEAAAIAIQRREYKEQLEKSATDIKLRQEKLSASQEAWKAAETQVVACRKKLTEVQNTVFAKFQAEVGIDSIAEIETREADRLTKREEGRQRLMSAVEKLKMGLDMAAQVPTGMKVPEQVESALKAASAELTQLKGAFETFQHGLSEVNKKAETAAKETAKLKQEITQLEKEMRSSSLTVEQNAQRLATLRRTLRLLNSNLESLRLQRLTLFQQCRMEGIEIPLLPASSASNSKRKSTRSNDNDDSGRIPEMSEPFTTYLALAESVGSTTNSETSICIIFTSLPDSLRVSARERSGFCAYQNRAEERISQLNRELDSLAPAFKGDEAQLSSTRSQLTNTSAEYESARQRQTVALREFHRVKEARKTRFLATFEELAKAVGKTYRDLTLNTRSANVYGSAFLTLDGGDEPYLGEVKYDAIPPMKRYMGIESLSGGERTMAALALLFAAHSVSQTSMFFLDEVDAALDIANVQRLARYLSTNAAGKTAQFVVISLKEQLYHAAESLVGIHKDFSSQRSVVTTLDLRQFD